MTDFTETLRQMCRNTNSKLPCGSKLPTPVANPKEAFCCQGCFNSFYRKRCLVCEKPMERRHETQLICGGRKCRNALKFGQIFGRFHGPLFP